MSEDDKKEIRGRTLLEVEDAKAELLLLRARAGQWCRAQNQVTQLLAGMGRENPQMCSVASAAKAAIARDLPLYNDTLTIAAIFALDTELEQAVIRLEKAEAEKRSLFA